MAAFIRTFGDICFRHVSDIGLETDSAGRFVEDTHTAPNHVRLNRHAAGPFCRLRIEPLPTSSGVYAIVVGEALKYVGRCEDLAHRFGPAGYGKIHKRNIQSDGQAANCKVNSRILSEMKGGNSVAIFFHESSDRYREIEAKLISVLTPPWNDRKESGTRMPLPREGAGKTASDHRSGAIKELFAAALRDEFTRATELGLPLVRIKAGELHTKVGGYMNRMPSCCSAMREAMGPHDRVLYAPPRGKGSRLTIEYHLPRPVKPSRLVTGDR